MALIRRIILTATNEDGEILARELIEIPSSDQFIHFYHDDNSIAKRGQEETLSLGLAEVHHIYNNQSENL